jgi:hypothetical protein
VAGVTVKARPRCATGNDRALRAKGRMQQAGRAMVANLVDLVITGAIVPWLWPK